jgi:hypothetical protein
VAAAVAVSVSEVRNSLGRSSCRSWVGWIFIERS